jgi:hypothetical protein
MIFKYPANDTRFQFLAILRSALKFIGLSSNDYNAHSFRIGAATTAAMLGINDNEIKRIYFSVILK